MARYTARPENALKLANEFIDMGKPLRALETLQEVFRNKRWNYSYSESVIEPLMLKYLYLCVKLRMPHVAKEGLFQYRNMFQLVNVNSLENVIRGYLRMAEEHTKAAQEQSSAAVAVLELDDLDNIATPESILLSAVCGEDAQDRSDRTILLPWVKFLWESYCQCLELLRVNTHCETLYHDIARMAFQFCLKYNRKSEFRRLCDKLRKHLEDICKNTNQTTGVSITKNETQQLCLETRLFQLDSAIQMELWQEAYKAIEDIHGLMSLSKKAQLPRTMANYYQKLAMVFNKAGNQLFHAAALLKLFQLTRELRKNLTKEDTQRMASHVLIATLSIPLPSAHPEFDRFIEADKSPLEKAHKLAVLLGLQQTPTRASLLKEVIRLNVPQLAGEEFRNLYNWLEVDFNPLNLCKRVQIVLDVIENAGVENNTLLPYTKQLKDVTIMRLIRQISQVYESIEFKRLLELSSFSTIFDMEKLLVESVRHNDMQIRIDHQKRCIYFGTDLTESQRENHTDGPTLQTMPSEQIRSQLVNMSTVLHRAVSVVYPNREKEQRAKLRAQMVHHYHEIKDREHQRILQRQKIIEDRKEFIEKQNNAREEEEARRLEEEVRRAKIAEQKRMEQENEERERKRHENEIQAIKEKSLKEKMQQISQTAHGKKMLSKLDEEGIKKLDAEQIAARESEELQRERKELQNRLKSQEKKVDYFERAKRLEEIPLFEKYLSEKEVKDKKFWELQEQTSIENAIAERKDAVAQQERLKRMYGDRDIFLEKLKSERSSLYEEKLLRFEQELVEERKRRLVQRIEKRRQERRAAWLREKEEERFRREEEIRRKQEEEERAAAEQRRKEREAEDEKRRAQFEKLRQKDEEERERMERERMSDSDKMKRNTRGGGETSGDWRRGAEPRSMARAPAKESETTTGGDSSWRARTTHAPAAAPAAPAAAAAAPVRETENKWRRGPAVHEERPAMVRDTRRGPVDRDREFRRDREEREPATTGNWRDAPRAAAPIERGEPRENRRVAPVGERRIGADRDRGAERGGDRDRGAERGGDRDRGAERGGDRERGAERGGDRERGAERGGDRGAERGGDRERDRNVLKSTGNWRTERQAPKEEKDKPAPIKREPQPQVEKDKNGDDGEWTSVKRR